MEIVPVIELKGGRSVRALQAREELRFFRTDDPVKIAKHFRDQGASRLQIHDLDGARVGSPQNRDIVRDIIRRVGVPVTFAGGVRTGEIADRVLNWGVDRVVAETRATLHADIKGTIERLGEKLALEIHDVQGKIRKAGPAGDSWDDVHEFTKRMWLEQGWARFLYMPSRPDGSPAPISVSQVERYLPIARKTVDLYGHIVDCDEIEELAATGLASICIAEALYEGTLTLQDANFTAQRAAAIARMQAQAAAPPTPQPLYAPERRPSGMSGPPAPPARPAPFPGAAAPRPAAQRPPMPPARPQAQQPPPRPETKWPWKK